MKDLLSAFLMANGHIRRPDAVLRRNRLRLCKRRPGDKPVITLGGEVRFARRIYFVSENWVLPVPTNNHYKWPEILGEGLSG
jgi:hypothetical protein